MCIAILNRGEQVKPEYLKNSWENNNQGAGLLWYEKGILKTYKTYKYNKLVKKYNEVFQTKGVGTIVLHFRIATSGYEKFTNLHPFMVNENLGFVHNGIISNLGDQKHSDTYEFNEILKQLPKDFLEHKHYLDLIKLCIGNSKLVFLDSENTYTIVNESSGIWDTDGNWYSNNSYKQNNDFVWYGNTKVSKGKDINYWGYDSYYDKNNLINETESADKEFNLNYIESYFKNTDSTTVNNLLYEMGKDLYDPKLIDALEELCTFYNTSDLKKILNESRNKRYSDRKSTRLNSSHVSESRMPSSA